MSHDSGEFSSPTELPPGLTVDGCADQALSPLDLPINTSIRLAALATSTTVRSGEVAMECNQCLAGVSLDQLSRIVTIRGGGECAIRAFLLKREDEGDPGVTAFTVQAMLSRVKRWTTSRQWPTA